MIRSLPCLLAAMFAVAAVPSVHADLVAHYSFDEGRGAVLHDRSGQGHNGRIVEAVWTRDEAGSALRFDGRGDYVDFGDNRALKQMGDFTCLAWVRLDPSVYPDYDTNWTVFDCETYPSEGTILRVDGSQAKLTFRSSRGGNPFGQFGRTRLRKGGRYLVGVVRRGDTAVMLLDGLSEGALPIGGNPVYGAVPFKISSTDQSFDGLIYDFKLYDRALSTGEIVSEYWSQAERFGKDAAVRGALTLRPHVYDTAREALAEINAFGVLPLARGEQLLVELQDRAGAVLRREAVQEVPPSCVIEMAFALDALPPGAYALAARVEGPDGVRASASGPFEWPAAPASPPPPGEQTVGPLPDVPPRPALDVQPAPDGGFIVNGAGVTLALESQFSVPNGPSLQLPGAGETENVAVRDRTVTAANAFYRLERALTVQTGRVLVRDTLTNLTDDPVGILFTNRVAAAGSALERHMLCGYEVALPAGRRIRTNPTAFAAVGGRGVGLVALDDVFIVQGKGHGDARSLGIGSDEFALAPRASYTLEWAVYVTPRADYYDLVNAIRHDEGRNNTTVEGAWCGIPGSQRRRAADVVPPAEFFQVRNVAYANIACLSWCTDDPSISLEGIEFIEYPRERAAVRETVDAIKAAYPSAKVMFHVAPNLYATAQPEKLWPDSRLVGSDGKQTVYAYAYERLRYFSRERHEQGWRWWSYYPALDNSYGKALLDSVDVMMGEMGCTGVFVDGFLWDYGGGYSYDRFDGHTADIDPETGTILRLKTAVPLKQQHAMVAYGQKVMDRGGVLVANNCLPTRTVASQPFIFDKEITEGPDMHLLPTPCTLGNPSIGRTERDMYRDVLAKLEWGNLYFYYGAPSELRYEPAPARLYPITVTEIRSSYVKGKERLVTALDGTYGWPGDRALHFVYRFDNRGRRVRHDFFTTADDGSVRTRIDLDSRELAVVVRVPVSIETKTPVNFVVDRLDDAEVEIALNGHGPVTLVNAAGRQHVDLDGPRRMTVRLRP